MGHERFTAKDGSPIHIIRVAHIRRYGIMMQSKCFPPKRIAQTCLSVLMGLDVKHIKTDFYILYYLIELKFGEYVYCATTVLCASYEFVNNSETVPKY